MKEDRSVRNDRQVALWLLAGVAMLIIQILLGGITRLTESGLSITEWEPIKGALPPLTDAQWQAAFAKYQTTDQYKYLHQSFTLSDFKFIFFWEWFHRFWARMIAVVFIIGFTYFLATKKFRKQMIKPLVILFLLGGMQGAIGWIMVASGLVPQMYFVGHVELATHFISAILLLSYTLWFAYSLLPSFKVKTYDSGLRRFGLFITLILFWQLIYGALMAGLKAGKTAPTWPDINGEYFPASIFELDGIVNNLFNNPMMVQLIHRSLAYLLFLLALLFFYVSRNHSSNSILNRFRFGLLLLVFTQVLLGIFTVLHSTSPNTLLWLGVLHQLTGMLVACCTVSILFLVKPSRAAS